jgi:hypothetical protein
MSWPLWYKAHAMRAFPAVLLRMHVAGIALTLLGVASLTAFAAATPARNDTAGDNAATVSANVSVGATQQTNVKKPHFNIQPGSQWDSQPGPSKWIRLCKEGQQCSSADDDIKRRSTFKA